MPRISKKDKVREILRILNKLYPNPEIPLRHKDPYTLLISVVLSAQCTDKRVNEVAPRLFSVANTPEKMAKVPQKKILEIVRSCGLSQNKSRAILELSKILVNKHGGKVPDSFSELEALPGVGHKTASVVMCQAFGKHAFPVDTHIHRLAYRWGLSNKKNVAQTERDLKRLFPQDSWAKIHLQMIYFGREHCPARGHEPTSCPICSKFGKR